MLAMTSYGLALFLSLLVVPNCNGSCVSTNTDITEHCKVSYKCLYDSGNLMPEISEITDCGVRKQKCNRSPYNHNCYWIFNHEYLQISLTLDQVTINPDSFTTSQGEFVSDCIKTLTLFGEKEVQTIIFELKKIKEITIVQGYIQDINLNKFAAFTELVSMNVSHNAISVLAYEQEIPSSTIQIIDLSYNDIEFLPNGCFSLFPYLQQLDLSHNDLKSFEIITFEGTTQLQYLDLSFNQLLEVGDTFARFSKVTRLSLNHNNLTTIVKANFKTMVNMEKLDLSSNQILSIQDDSFQSLSKLKELYLNDNKLSIVKRNYFKQNNELHKLFLSNNNITTIEKEVFKNKNITNFSIKNNKITGEIESRLFEGIHTDALDLSNCQLTILKTEAFYGLHTHVLNLSTNALTKISTTAFKEVRHLKELDLSNNKILDISFDKSDLEELVIFNARNNAIKNISKITFEHFISLTKLDLSHNNISELEPKIFLKLKKLEFLDLSHNVLSNEFIPQAFAGMTDLKIIQLTNSKATSIQNDSFSGLEVLKILNCSRNEVTNLSYAAFNNTGSIEILDLSYNLLELFIVNTTDLSLVKELYLNDNKIRTISKESFLNLKYLQKIYLNNNNIASIEPKVFMSFSNLSVINLSSNTASGIDVIFNDLCIISKVYINNFKKSISFEHSVNTSIRQLDLSRNDIENVNTLYIHKVKYLEYLDLNSNKITFVDKMTFENMPFLTHLDLSRNLISFIQPGSFLRTINIRYMELQHNKLKSLPFGCFEGLSNLDKLNLSTNMLKEFGKNLLHSTPHVTFISLDNNLIENINFDDFAETNISTLSVGGNMISCHVFVEIKARHSLNYRITAENLDFHSENVDGVRCISNNNDHLINTGLLNTTAINTTLALLVVSNAVENIRSSISDATKNITIAIDKLRNVSMSKAGKEVSNVKFANINESDFITQNIKMLNLEKEKMFNELKEIFEDLKNNRVANNIGAQTSETSSTSDVKILLYFIVVCLLILITMLSFKFFLYPTKSNSRHYRNILNDSTQPLGNIIELRDT